MTKIAVLSDIHSNVWALQAVIQDAKSKGVAQFINLGDVLYGPLAPRATYDLLQTQTMHTIKGNQDRQIYEATAPDTAANTTMQFILEDLQAEPLQWMQKLPATLSLPEGIFLCHGTPDDDMIYLLEEVSSGIPQVRAKSEIESLVGGVLENLILCAHSHMQRMVALDNGQLIVNPGSVGLPAFKDDEPIVHAMQNFSSHAAYAIIEHGDLGWNVEFVKILYDVASAINAATKRGRTDWAWALKSGTVA